MNNKDFIDISIINKIKLNNNINIEYNSDYVENYHDAMDEFEKNEFIDSIPAYPEINYLFNKDKKVKRKNMFDIK